jgi:hypothetical protein
MLLIGATIASGTAEPTAISSYRNIALGDSVSVVVQRLDALATDVKVLHDRGSLVQELTWRPHRFVSGTAVTYDPLAEMVLTFHKDQLVRIVATYDRERTQGLTDTDLRDSLTNVYGVATLRSTPTQPAVLPTAPRQTIGRWEDAETLLLLWREEYPSRVGLTITAVTADEALQAAITSGLRLDVAEGPQRELDQRAAAAAAIKARDEKIRLDNKAKFKP